MSDFFHIVIMNSQCHNVNLPEESKFFIQTMFDGYISDGCNIAHFQSVY